MMGCEIIKHLEKEYPVLITDRIKKEKKRKTGFEYVIDGFIIIFKLYSKSSLGRCLDDMTNGGGRL